MQPALALNLTIVFTWIVLAASVVVIFFSTKAGLDPDLYLPSLERSWLDTNSSVLGGMRGIQGKLVVGSSGNHTNTPRYRVQGGYVSGGGREVKVILRER